MTTCSTAQIDSMPVRSAVVARWVSISGNANGPALAYISPNFMRRCYYGGVTDGRGARWIAPDRRQVLAATHETRRAGTVRLRMPAGGPRPRVQQLGTRRRGWRAGRRHVLGPAAHARADRDLRTRLAGACRAWRPHPAPRGP